MDCLVDPNQPACRSDCTKSDTGCLPQDLKDICETAPDDPNCISKGAPPNAVDGELNPGKTDDPPPPLVSVPSSTGSRRISDQNNNIFRGNNIFHKVHIYFKMLFENYLTKFQYNKVFIISSFMNFLIFA